MRIVSVRMKGMSASATSQPRASGRAATPSAIDLPVPPLVQRSAVPPSASTSPMARALFASTTATISSTAARSAESDAAITGMPA